MHPIVGGPACERAAAAARAYAQSRKLGPGVTHTVSNIVQMFSFPVVGRVPVGITPLAASSVSYPGLVPTANIGSPALTKSVVGIDPAHKRIRLGGSN